MNRKLGHHSHWPKHRSILFLLDPRQTKPFQSPAGLHKFSYIFNPVFKSSFGQWSWSIHDKTIVIGSPTKTVCRQNSR